MEEKYIGIRQATKDGFIKMEVGGCCDLLYPSSKLRRGRVQGDGHICPTIATSNGVCKIMDREMIQETILNDDYEGSKEYWDQIDKANREEEKAKFEVKTGAKVEDFLVDDFGIFKLSTRELGRLQGVTDEDITKMMAVNSNTQCMRQFGNSICVPVLMAVFSQLNIQGVKPWNECTDQENNERALKGIVSYQ